MASIEAHDLGRLGEFAWEADRLIPVADAQVHALNYSLHYALSAWEGIRCYGGVLFRLADHVRRLLRSAKILGLRPALAPSQIETAIVRTVTACGLADCYIRPILYVDSIAQGVFRWEFPVTLAVFCWQWDALHGDRVEQGIRVVTSSVVRSQPNSLLLQAKCSANYVTTILAEQAAMVAGYDDALLLDHRGTVVEGSCTNLFVLTEGTLITPPPGSVLLGITRDTVMRRFETVQQDVTREAVYTADEVFLTGTASEIVPVVEIDGREIGDGAVGPVTRQVIEDYRRLTRSQSGQAAWYAEAL